MNLKKIVSATLFLIVLFLLPNSLKAQDSAAMTGVVSDDSGAVIPDAKVTLKSTKTNATYEAVTNSGGSYTFSNVPPGPGYTATFSRDGFQPVTVTDIYLTVANTRTQNAKLQVGTVAQSIQVSAGAEEVTLNTTDATVGNNFDVKLVNELPVQTRDTPAALFTLQPGVTEDGATTGARVDQNNVTLDGLDVNDIATGQAFSIVANAPVDSVQEFRGVSAGFAPDSGPGGGGQFQLVTKSGTNQFHGNLNEYHRDTATTANDWFNNYANVARPALIRNQFGGNLGGPIIRDRFFFFFDYNNSRIVQSAQVNRIVPLDSFRNGNVSYIKLGNRADGGVCNGASRQNTTPECIDSLNAAQVAAIDPAGIGFNAGLLSFVNQRYPHANDLAQGDGINTGGYRFNSPTPRNLTDYVGRLDYTINNSMKVFGRFTIARENRVYAPVQFPGDPVTSPFIDRSYAWVAGHTWTIGSNKVNQFIYGKTVSDFSFPNTYNPQGTSLLTFADGLSTFLDDAYSSPVNAQSRNIPIPVVRDDFSWQKGHHNLQFGGQFKFIKSFSNTKLDYTTAEIGLGGNLLGLDASVRPANIRTAGTVAANTYDYALAFALGRVANINSGYNYDNKGNVIPQGTGDTRRYRYYQTELYFGDTWKVTPSLTLSYGLNYQIYSVPYEVNGLESVEPLSFDKYFQARLVQSAASNSGNSSVPLITYQLGGKANHGPDLYKPSYKDIAPRFAFAYNPEMNRKMVVNGGIGVVYDRTVINAVQYQQDQHSYLFQQAQNTPYGDANDARGSLKKDPRLGANNALPALSPPPAISIPFQPFVQDGAPFGLANGQAFNTIIDPTLKTPYSVAFNFGVQYQLPKQFIVKTSYVGRLGRRLLAQADANQLIEFVDPGSGQKLSDAFGNITLQARAGQQDPTPQPWFENQVGAGGTALIYSALGNLVFNGDFADTVQALAANQLIAPNVGMASQFSENTFYTNKGSSNYHGLLTTVQKNLSNGLQFDFNYTYAHSIDNVSLIANQGAAGGYGFICDATRLEECRGNSDFDVKHLVSADFTYALPVGRGRQFAANAPRWLDEAIGGWDISGITRWHTGIAYGTVSSAFVAGYSNDAPGIFNGDKRAVSPHAGKKADGSVNIFADQQKAINAFTGPVGFTIGSRNNLRGPNYFNQDFGLAKTFPIVRESLILKFRADAFNALNHPSFDLPNGANVNNPLSKVDITNSNFGQLTTTANSARVMQFALRLEF